MKMDGVSEVEMMEINAVPKISICLCTYKRAELLTNCLISLLNQNNSLQFEIIVTDNDSACSGKPVFDRMEAQFSEAGVPFFYQVEPVQNIALARNRCVRVARGEFVAFMDDDEIASPSWINNLYETLNDCEADGVWGPVEPIIPESFPEWMRKSRIFVRPNPRHKSLVRDTDLRTGNAMIKRSLLTMREGPFCEKLGRIGGSDSEYFSWLRIRGSKFIWGRNAEVYEHIEEKRRYLRWHLIRGYRGGWSYAFKLVMQRGWIAGFIISIGRIVPSMLRSFCLFTLRLNNPRASLYILIEEISGHVGKIGFFINIKIEEYK
jgi:succinoglycan biosynthesis protein ExoM